MFTRLADAVPWLPPLAFFLVVSVAPVAPPALRAAEGVALTGTARTGVEAAHALRTERPGLAEVAIDARRVILGHNYVRLDSMKIDFIPCS